LNPVFERTSKGTRTTGDPASVPDNTSRTLLPLFAPSILRLRFGRTERTTVSLTAPLSITELSFVCAETPAETNSNTPISMKTWPHVGLNSLAGNK